MIITTNRIASDKLLMQFFKTFFPPIHIDPFSFFWGKENPLFYQNTSISREMEMYFRLLKRYQLKYDSIYYKLEIWLRGIEFNLYLNPTILLKINRIFKSSYIWASI